MERRGICDNVGHDEPGDSDRSASQAWWLSYGILLALSTYSGEEAIPMWNWATLFHDNAGQKQHNKWNSDPVFHSACAGDGHLAVDRRRVRLRTRWGDLH